MTVHLVIDYVFQLLGHIVTEQQPQQHSHSNNSSNNNIQCDERKENSLSHTTNNSTTTATTTTTTITQLRVNKEEEMTAPIHLLREVIYDAVENIDFFTSTTTYKR